MSDNDAPSGIDWSVLWTRLTALDDRRDDVLAVVNGAIGDRLTKDGSPHALGVELRHRGRRLNLGLPLAEQLPDAQSRVLISVHGLMATDRFWGQIAAVGLPERLGAVVDATVIDVRYNTGVHLSTSGKALAILLDALVEAWPAPVHELSFVAHSMGGLVTRSALYYGEQAHHRWVTHTRRAFLLGVPQRGAPLEQVAHLAEVTLRHIPNPWTWGIAWLLRQRSDGIQDLRHGWLIDEEWLDRDPKSLSFRRRFPVAPPEHVQVYAVAGSLASHEHHPLAKLVGDAMVTPFSAKDEGIDGTPTERAPTASQVFPGLSHVAVAGHDAVFEQIVAWWREG